MAVPASVVELVERFDRNIESYKKSGYNETQVRHEFIDPFFESLGWDINNTKGYAEAYKEVIHEDAIRIGSATKAPDYCFRIGGTRKFFLEAKKPSIDIKGDPGPAYQLRRYAWSAKLPLSVLTDFEEFAVYDCRVRPAPTDKSSTARVLFLTWRDYIERWDEIASIFSRDAVLKGSFDKYADKSRLKKGTAEVDASFLAEIEGWREALAKNIALRNPQLNHRELNFSVQLTIDRIIFLRICEDRGVERYGELMALLNGETVYERLLGLFRRADDRYNSGLFHFTTEKDRHDPPDELTPNLTIDDNVLKDIFRPLYYPDCPFEFSVLPAEILGQVYEQFLGSTITLTSGHRAKVENKPEVKKAGGVFYTPAYIVDYIVENTVGKLVAGKTPKQVSKIKILDPACGSGSFLLGAYRFLLDWHLKYYLDNDPDQWARKKEPPVCSVAKGSSGILPESQDAASKKHLPCEGEVAEGRRGLLRLSHLPASRITPSPLRGTPPSQGESFKLTLTERKRILLDCLYGVDIDSQAVEVTKLSLLLKVLEGEKQLNLFATERALPDLCDNIKCGNSLIGSDFYTGQQMALFDDEMHYKINAFDWDKEFPEIFKGKDPGFDAVIGNPPYIRIQRIGHEQADYFFEVYKGPTSKTDISQVFLEKSLSLISNSGWISFISTSQWLSTDYGRNMRNILSDGTIHEIVDFGSLPVFQKVDTYPAIFLLHKKPTDKMRVKVLKSKKELSLSSIVNAKILEVPITSLSQESWVLGGLSIADILSRGNIPFQTLNDFAHAYIGALTGMDAAFVVADSEIKEKHLEPEILVPYAYRGNEINKYSCVVPNAKTIYPYLQGKNNEPVLIDEDVLKNRYPNVHSHLTDFKNQLRERKDSRKYYAKGKDWYRYLRPGSYKYIIPEKLLIKGIDTKSTVGLLPGNTLFNGANCPGIIFDGNDSNLCEYSKLYFLGLLNSKLLSYHLRSICPSKLGGYTRFNATNICKAPIRTIDFSNKAEKRLHDELVSLVEGMLGLHERLAAARTGDEKVRLQRQIEAADAQIDRLVYDLYGLTEEEIGIVEGV
jgi:hypothetical protein